MTDIIQSIIQKVKDELRLEGEFSSTELYNQLFEYRTNLHPDKFLYDDQKQEAEEKFKKVNALLSELERFIKEEKLAKKPGEIIPYKDSYEIVTIKQTNVQIEEKIKSLESTITAKDYELKELKKEIRLLRNEKADEKTQELVKHYKPTKKSLFSLGLTFLVTLLFGILSKIDEIAVLISKYSPLKEKFLNTIIFVILIAIPLIYAKKSYEEKIIERAANRVKTPLFINGFVEYLEEYKLGNNFSELNVYNFLVKQLVPRNFFSKYYYTKVLPVFTEATIDSLKDIFIYNLLIKKLIYISNPNMLDRTFRIWNSPHYFPGQFDDEF
ncbi:hypothetical protein SAMN05444008_11579 [Cnuella takakiae]|uniref:Uncharacterized protein n=1 Tax=Cnuella takakiae TaxID=1302690 RepID=A0A1M5G300_9BACT|nr:hypothetical protein [Cnuella takakiae]OLY92313.1 hypothetical protein BUE76_10705 [Cnuella takakiae]SHF98093.1 hypothetical protein SAMN05444008_11579 [Cnuella takakiae]